MGLQALKGMMTMIRNLLSSPLLRRLLLAIVIATGIVAAPAAQALASPVTITAPAAEVTLVSPVVILRAPAGLHVTRLRAGRADLAWGSVPGARVYELRIEPSYGPGTGTTYYDHVLRPGQRSAYALLRPGRYVAIVRAGLSVAAMHGHWSAPVRFGVPRSVPVISSRAGQAVRFAYDQIGCPYVYGATGPCGSGFDCSGLVMAAWRSAGVSIPRTTYEQWAALEHVSRSSLQPGDIVFGNGFGHAMLYVGGGYVIQAPHSGASVEKTPLSDTGAIDGYARA
jgi:NlpC/P60 family